MDPETRDQLLVDLLYGELDGTDAEEARAALAEDGQTAVLERLSMARRLADALPLEEPSPAVADAIVAAARQKVGAEEPEAQPAARPAAVADEDEGLWAAVLRWLGGFAMGPQVAMATIMGVVVAIGLWYLPQRDREPEATGSTVISPDHGGEAGPSATLSPAEPLDLQLDPRTGRVHARDGDEPGGPGAAAVPTRRQERAGESGGGVISRALDEERQGVRASAEEQLAPAEDDLAPAPAPTPALEMLAERDEGGAPSRPSTVPSQPAQRAPAGASAGSYGDTATYDRARTRYERGDYRGAAQDYESVVQGPSGSMLPDALYQLAQSHRRAGACAAAVPHFQRFLQAHPQHARVPDALINLADCYRRMNQLAAARTTLQRAESHQRVRATARRELTRIDTLERAQRRPVVDDEVEAAEAESAF